MYVTVFTVALFPHKALWELMFTRSMFQTRDMYKQGQILARMAALVDDGAVKATETEVFHGLSAATIKKRTD